MGAKNRKDIDPAFQWDFTHIYESDDAWEQACLNTEKAIDAIPACAGTLGNSADTLLHALNTISAAEQLLTLVSVYASLKLSSDNGDPAFQSMDAKAEKLGVRLGTACAFVEPEILSIPAETLHTYMKDSRLATYRHRIDDIERGRAHTLDAEREKLLAMTGDLSGNPQQTFTMFESVDLTFPDVIDENGKPAPLTHGTFGVYRESRSQAVRKDAFEKYFGAFNRFINMLASTYSGSVKFDTFFSQVRGFSSACEAALFRSNVPVSVYDSLIEAIHKGLPIMHRYLQLRKEVLGLDELNMYDLYNPIVDNVEIDMPYENAKDLVKKALRPLGEKYQHLLDRAYSEHWIDVYENKGKTTGAFSCGVHGVHPYVLLNYTNTLDDAFTLAHELGHAMHSYLSSEAQDFENHDYKILVAEVASTVNEVLLTQYLLSTETDPHRRAYIMNHFLEGFRTTVFRQALFAEFERKAHDMYQSGQALTAQTLNALYKDLNEQYYKGAVVTDLMSVEWARIPHFYRAFYVYQYSTGFCSAVAIADGILKTGNADNYLRFLTTGGSDYPLNELKIAGVDLTRPDTVENALRVFDETLTEFEKLVKSL